jgi:hypothetical protein
MGTDMRVEMSFQSPSQMEPSDFAPGGVSHDFETSTDELSSARVTTIEYHSRQLKRVLSGQIGAEGLRVVQNLRPGLTATVPLKEIELVLHKEDL